MSALTQQRAVRFKKQARTRFDGWADTYDRSLLNHYMFRPSYLALMEEIARWRAEHGDAFRLLDIGSGTGTLAGMLLGGGWPVTVVGLDYSPAMCAKALAKLPPTAHANRLMFTAGDSERVPFASESFDLVICANSFHHYPNQRAVLEEMRRVLRPDGRFILIDGFRDNVVGWFVFDVIIARVERLVHHAPWHEIHAGFEQAGLRNIRRRKLGLLFPLIATIGDA